MPDMEMTGKDIIENAEKIYKNEEKKLMAVQAV